MVRVVFCAVGLWLWALSAAGAQPTDESNPQGEQAAAVTDQAAMDKAIEDINAARAATAEALNSAPLGFRHILFVSEIPEGFADYQPRADNIFKPDEPLIVYTEPIGVSWTKSGDEVSSKLVVDFEILLPEGKIIAGHRGFGEFALSAREPPLDFMTQFKIDVTGAPAGAYILGLTMHDTNSGKSTTKDLPFEIR
jgi:hypothetical protein